VLSSFTALFIQQLPGLRKYAFEHLARQPAGVRVVAAAMIRIEQEKFTEIVQRGVRELEFRLAAPDRFDYRAMSNTAECKHNGIVGKLLQLGGQECIAVVDLGTDRLIVGRQTLDGIRNSALRQFQVVVGTERLLG